MATDRTEHRPTALDVAVFVDELLLLAVLAVAGAGIGSTGPLRVLLAIVLPVAAAVIWGLWLAPRASRRLRSPASVVAKIALFTAAAVVLGITGAVLWATLFWVVSVALLVAAEVSERRGAP